MGDTADAGTRGHGEGESGRMGDTADAGTRRNKQSKKYWTHHCVFRNNHYVIEQFGTELNEKAR